MLVRDRTGALRAVWFNQPFLNDVFHPHQRVILFGKLELTSHGLQLQNPQYEVLQQRRQTRDDAASDAVDDDTLHTGRIVPIYEKTGHADDEDAARARAPGAGAAAGGRCRIRCRPTCARGSS